MPKRFRPWSQQEADGSKPDDICTVLSHRMARYRDRYGKDPDDLPVTLDEWFWLSEALTAELAATIDIGKYTVFVPTALRGVPLKLVLAVVYLSDGGVKIVP